MIVWRNQRIIPLGLAEDLQRPVSNHFVGVHVHRSAGAALDAIDHELILPLAGNDFFRGFYNRSANHRRHPTGPHIGPGRRRFDNSQRDNEIFIDYMASNRKIVQCTRSLNPIV